MAKALRRPGRSFQAAKFTEPNLQNLWREAFFSRRQEADAIFQVAPAGPVFRRGSKQ